MCSQVVPVREGAWWCGCWSAACLLGRKLRRKWSGTNTVDGILGVGSDGVPTAWVDRGEFVVNRESTEAFEPLLWAINSGEVGRLRVHS